MKTEDRRKKQKFEGSVVDFLNESSHWTWRFYMFRFLPNWP